MSFNDLTARAAAAMKPKPDEAAKTSAKENETKPAGEDISAKSRTS